MLVLFSCQSLLSKNEGVLPERGTIGERRRHMGSGGGSLRAFFGALAFVGFIWFLLAKTLASGGIQTTTTTALTTPTTGSFKHLEVMETDSPVVHPDLDPTYMSKRRVPNGPDPIHNRRAGNSRRPPGRP